MTKICIQAGHKNMVSGGTGAPGERDWNSKIVPMVAKKLKALGIEVYETDAFANKDLKVTKTDWDLFLAVHYDADIYNDRGGFADYPDPKVDKVNNRSKYLAENIQKVFFTKTKIPVKSRSNGNTKFYYMWDFLSEQTPCVLIECGVGWRKPEDYETLRNYELVASALTDAISLSLGVVDSRDKEIEELKAKIKKLDEDFDGMQDSRNKWRDTSGKQKKEIEKLNARIQDFIANSNKFELIKAIFLGK